MCVGGRTHERVLHGADGHGPPGVVVLEEGVVHQRQPASFFQHSALSRALSLTHTLSLRHAHTDTLDTHTHTHPANIRTPTNPHTPFTQTHTHARTHTHAHTIPIQVHAAWKCEKESCARVNLPRCLSTQLSLSFSLSYTHTYTKLPAHGAQHSAFRSYG